MVILLTLQIEQQHYLYRLPTKNRSNNSISLNHMLACDSMDKEAKSVCEIRVWNEITHHWGATQAASIILIELTSSNFLLVSDFGIQISTISVVHYDTETALVHEGLLVGDNIGVSHCFEYMDLNQK